MKKQWTLFLPLIAASACSESAIVEIAEKGTNDGTRAISEVEFSFDSITRPEVWATYQSLEEMQQACQIPDSILPLLSTEKLVKACADYPLYGIYSAYNDEMDGIKVIMDGFNGFKELEGREDASAALIDFYQSFDADEMAIAMVDDTNHELYLNPIRLGYWELLLSSDEISSIINDVDLARLTQLQSVQLQKKESQPTFFGKRTQQRAEMLGRGVVGNVGNAKKTIKSSSATTVTTKCGKTVQAYLFDELSDYERGYWDGYYDASFPNAARIGTSSSTYNCHGYAWCKSDGGKTCWINGSKNVYGDNLNIANYWTKDYYVSTTEDLAVKINYPNSDHSAIYAGDGMYVSKWGNCPLMRHAPGYGPYPNMNVRTYYRHDNYYGLLTCSEGDGEYEVGTTATYSIPNLDKFKPTGTNLKKEWIVENAKGEDAVGNGVVLTVKSEGVAEITFNRSGNYDVYYVVSLKDSGQEIIKYNFLALVSY